MYDHTTMFLASVLRERERGEGRGKEKSEKIH
jgi:hypothetical protein